MNSQDFERLFEQYAGGLFSFLAYRTGDRALAEDLAGETFERALRARRRFDPRRASEKTWLYTIGLNCLRDHLRRSATEQQALERSAVTEATASNPVGERVESHDELRRGLAVLSEAEREVIALRYGADLTVPEVARATGERLTTVEGRVYRALRKLRDEMGGEDGP